MTEQAWRAYLCGIHGHVVSWASASTGTSFRVGVCSRCGATVRR